MSRGWFHLSMAELLKNCMKFLRSSEIWSVCRCDMKIIFGVFDNLDAKLFSNKIFWCCHAISFDSGSVYFISECQGHKIMSVIWAQPQCLIFPKTVFGVVLISNIGGGGESKPTTKLWKLYFDLTWWFWHVLW